MYVITQYQQPPTNVCLTYNKTNSLPFHFAEFAQPRLPSLDLKFISFDVDDHFDSIQSLAKDISMDQLVKNIHGLKGAEKPRAGQLAGPNISAAFPTPVNRSIFTEAGQGTFNMPPMAVWGGEQNQPASSPMISPRSDASSSSPEEMSRDFVGSHFQYNGKCTLLNDWLPVWNNQSCFTRVY